MIKKHLITCSVILVLVIVSKLFIFGTTEVKPATQFSHFYRFKVYTETKKTTVNFANEELPVNNKKVDYKLAYSIKKHEFENYQTAAMQRKVQHLFAIIEPVLKFYGIPEDFKYMPLVESSLHGEVSVKGAAGVWQFMPQTAREYGLTVNRKKDDRLNIRKSTIAACKYLRELYAQFDSWTLAAAAYNGGSPRIKRAINHQNEDNYYLMRLNRETGSYLYKLIAVKQLLGKEEEQDPESTQTYTWLKPSELLAVN